jgi:hypothetical protein
MKRLLAAFLVLFAAAALSCARPAAEARAEDPGVFIFAIDGLSFDRTVPSGLYQIWKEVTAPEPGGDGEGRQAPEAESGGSVWNTVGTVLAEVAPEDMFGKSLLEYLFSATKYRPAYLRQAMADLAVDPERVYSFGGGEDESWSGDAAKTPEIMAELLPALREKYQEQAVEKGRKFVVVTHSWGTVLGTTALTWLPEVEPDLFITLSSPLGADNVTGFDNEPFVPEAMESAPSLGAVQTVKRVQQIVSLYAAWQIKATARSIPRPDNAGVRAARWVNFWDPGDVISGPIKTPVAGENSTQCENRMVGMITDKRNAATTTVVHALTTLNPQVMRQHQVEPSMARPLQDQVAGLIRELGGQ